MMENRRGNAGHAEFDFFPFHGITPAADLLQFLEQVAPVGHGIFRKLLQRAARISVQVFR